MSVTVVLAAGRSRRYGWSNKLLARAGGEPLIAITVRQVLRATRGPVLLVTDHQAPALRRALKSHGVLSNRLRIVYAAGARHDMTRSRAFALAAAPRLASVVQIHLADVPVFDRRLAHRLWRAIHGGATATRPVYRGHPGHPVCLSRERLSGLVAGNDPQPILRSLPATVWHHIQGPPGCVRDIDRRRMMRGFNRAGAATGIGGGLRSRFFLHSRLNLGAKTLS
ncbi:nucleotidyltransferase family protein [Salinisphaera sp.]|uniref:nucleotidyltransferase family protein n=1 Tax=Salinisphaera sp. TaxID=1914330 RepID=UPI002D76D801|nr:NTP transferase domain-containing protein [Salinisphaera sp.]HET7315529.1 NTP transferase domain-containing protein [Salinisphaera sp.]